MVMWIMVINLDYDGSDGDVFNDFDTMLKLYENAGRE